MPLSPTRRHLRPIWYRYSEPNGWSMPSARSAGHRPCWPLSRYTHRVAIANSRLIACDHSGVTFRWKDYRADGRDRQKVMTLSTGKFIRRFLIHVLPHGFYRIRHYGLLASGTRADNIARARRLLDVPEAGDTNCAEATEPKPLSQPCPCCGGRMIIIERFQRGASPRYRPAASTAAI